MNKSFNVFLSHNSKSKPAIREVAEALSSRGLKVWLDEWELIPGRPWQMALEEIIETTQSAAVLVGSDGIGPWQDAEMRGCLAEFAGRNLPVIPVLLPGAPEVPHLPIFLKGFTWVDLRGGLTKEGIDQLQWGITGTRPDRSKSPSILADIPEPAFRKAALQMLLIGLTGWVVAWFLPSNLESNSSMPGWACFMAAASLIKGAFNGASVAFLLAMVSPWTNFLIPLGMVAFRRGRVSWVRRIAVLLLFSFGVNLVWAWGGKSTGLLIGYYLWVASFLLLGLSALLFLKSPWLDRDSVRLMSQTNPKIGKAIKVGAWLIFLGLVGLLVLRGFSPR